MPRTVCGSTFCKFLRNVNWIGTAENSIYCGFLKNGDAVSSRIEALQIIDDRDFAMA